MLGLDLRAIDLKYIYMIYINNLCTTKELIPNVPTVLFNNILYKYIRYIMYELTLNNLEINKIECSSNIYQYFLQKTCILLFPFYYDLPVDG